MEPSGAEQLYHVELHAAQMLHSIDEFTFLPKVSGYLQAHYIAPKVKALLHIMNHDTSVASCQYHPESPISTSSLHKTVGLPPQRVKFRFP